MLTLRLTTLPEVVLYAHQMFLRSLLQPFFSLLNYLHPIQQVLASWVRPVQFGLIYVADKAVSLRHRALWGTFGETDFQFIL